MLPLYLCRDLNPTEAMVPRKMVVCQRGLSSQAAGQALLSSPARCLVVPPGFQEVAVHRLHKRPNLATINPTYLELQLQEAPVMTLFGVLSFSLLGRRRGSEERDKRGKRARWFLVWDFLSRFNGKAFAVYSSEFIIWLLIIVCPFSPLLLVAIAVSRENILLQLSLCSWSLCGELFLVGTISGVATTTFVSLLPLWGFRKLLGVFGLILENY